MSRARLLTVGVALAAALAVLGFWGYEISENPANQIFGKTVVSGPPDARIVALTYDDGPNPPYTGQILDVLKKEHVHATFFVVGRAVARYPQVVSREIREGNAVGNHTWEHAHLIVMNRAAIRDDLRKTDRAIYAAGGMHTRLLRPPYGSRDWLVLDEARRLGYVPVMWSVPLARDWEYPTAKTIAARILPFVVDGSIIVLHDGNQGIVCTGRTPPRVCDRSADIGATRLIVETLKARGYRFVTIPELLERGRATRTPAPGSE